MAPNLGSLGFVGGFDCAAKAYVSTVRADCLPEAVPPNQRKDLQSNAGIFPLGILLENLRADWPPLVLKILATDVFPDFYRQFARLRSRWVRAKFDGMAMRGESLQNARRNERLFAIQRRST